MSQTTSPIFRQSIIAVVWDFDKTLIPGYMQEPIFSEYGVNEAEFWKEVREAANRYRNQNNGQVSDEIVYLNHILDYVKQGKFAGLNNAKLRGYGKELNFFPGLPEFFEILQNEVEGEGEQQQKYRDCDIKLEHYVISSGLRQIILGSTIADYLTDVWGCELVEETNELGEQVLAKIGYVLDHTTKTRAIFEINKGVNKEKQAIDVNARMPDEHRRVPVSQMIYIADGPSDVPVFSVIQRYGGKSIAVYPPDADVDTSAYKQVYKLQEDERVNHAGPADFNADSPTARWLRRTVHRIAERIVQRKAEAIKENVGSAPTHL